jgi:hypothetical protein
VNGLGQWPSHSKRSTFFFWVPVVIQDHCGRDPGQAMPFVFCCKLKLWHKQYHPTTSSRRPHRVTTGSPFGENLLLRRGVALAVAGVRVTDGTLNRELVTNCLVTMSFFWLRCSGSFLWCLFLPFVILGTLCALPFLDAAMRPTFCCHAAHLLGGQHSVAMRLL